MATRLVILYIALSVLCYGVFTQVQISFNDQISNHSFCKVIKSLSDNVIYLRNVNANLNPPHLSNSGHIDVPKHSFQLVWLSSSVAAYLKFHEKRFVPQYSFSCRKLLVSTHQPHVTPSSQQNGVESQDFTSNLPLGDKQKYKKNMHNLHEVSPNSTSLSQSPLPATSWASAYIQLPKLLSIYQMLAKVLLSSFSEKCRKYMHILHQLRPKTSSSASFKPVLPTTSLPMLPQNQFERSSLERYVQTSVSPLIQPSQFLSREHAAEISVSSQIQPPESPSVTHTEIAISPHTKYPELSLQRHWQTSVSILPQNVSHQSSMKPSFSSSSPSAQLQIQPPSSILASTQEQSPSCTISTCSQTLRLLLQSVPVLNTHTSSPSSSDNGEIPVFPTPGRRHGKRPFKKTRKGKKKIPLHPSFPDKPPNPPSPSRSSHKASSSTGSHNQLPVFPTPIPHGNGRGNIRRRSKTRQPSPKSSAASHPVHLPPPSTSHPVHISPPSRSHPVRIPPSPSHPHMTFPARVPSAWCVANRSMDELFVEEAMEIACAFQGADCKAIQPGGPCFEPNTLWAHASYVFNSYWQRTKHLGGSCTFDGAAKLTFSDPSYQSCTFEYKG